MKFTWFSLIGLLCAVPKLVFASPPIAVKSTAASGGTLLQFDFRGANSWPGSGVWSTPNIATASVAQKPVGTVDVANTTEPSGGMLLSVKDVPASGKWGAGLKSGLLPVHNAETNLGKLTLSFSLSASTSEPVTVRIESFDATKRRTGGLTGSAAPAAPNFFQRYALDLSSLKSFGAGKFQPAASYVQFTFERSSAAAAAGANGLAGHEYQIRLDNVNYASPAYYVSPRGNDKSDGRTETTAFATPQRALDLAQPGDIVLLMDGTYKAGLVPVAAFPRPGAPAAWIVLKNYPGQHPMLTSEGWNIVSLVQGANGKQSSAPPLAYLEIRGLHVRGDGDIVKQKFPDSINRADSRSNSNGIAADGRYTTGVFHDIRIADNLVEYCPAGGISTNESDWVTIENNVSRFNSWTTSYGPSGISTLGASNFDKLDNVYKILVRNNVCYGNETKELCYGKYTDGNGIIIDVNQKTNIHPDSAYIGRTLVQSNLCVNNGGSGIHTVRAYHVDIVNNTAYLNSASPHFMSPEIYAYGSEDVRIINNIMVAPVANVAAGGRPIAVNGMPRSSNVLFSHNLYFGGNIAPKMGEGDAIGDPMFVKPGIEPATADFHLQPGSPAIGKGMNLLFLPWLDLDGRVRHRAAPTLGAYE